MPEHRCAAGGEGWVYHLSLFASCSSVDSAPVGSNVVLPKTESCCLPYTEFNWQLFNAVGVSGSLNPNYLNNSQELVTLLAILTEKGT